MDWGLPEVDAVVCTEVLSHLKRLFDIYRDEAITLSVRTVQARLSRPLDVLVLLQECTSDLQRRTSWHAHKRGWPTPHTLTMSTPTPPPPPPPVPRGSWPVGYFPPPWLHPGPPPLGCPINQDKSQGDAGPTTTGTPGVGKPATMSARTAQPSTSPQQSPSQPLPPPNQLPGCQGNLSRRPTGDRRPIPSLMSLHPRSTLPRTQTPPPTKTPRDQGAPKPRQRPGSNQRRKLLLRSRREAQGRAQRTNSAVAGVAKTPDPNGLGTAVAADGSPTGPAAGTNPNPRVDTPVDPPTGNSSARARRRRSRNHPPRPRPPPSTLGGISILKRNSKPTFPEDGEPCVVKGCLSVPADMRAHVLDEHLPPCFRPLGPIPGPDQLQQLRECLDCLVKAAGCEDATGLLGRVQEEKLYSVLPLGRRLRDDDRELLEQFTLTVAPQPRVGWALYQVDPPHLVAGLIHWRVAFWLIHSLQLLPQWPRFEIPPAVPEQMETGETGTSPFPGGSGNPMSPTTLYGLHTLLEEPGSASPGPEARNVVS